LEKHYDFTTDYPSGDLRATKEIIFMKNTTINLLIMVILLIMTTCKSVDGGDAPRSQDSDTLKQNRHLKTSNSIRDVVNHPSFKGFGQFILPLDRGTYDGNMQLNRVGSLLPYHSQVEPEAVVKTINYMIDQVADGKTIFYTFYTERQKLETPAKQNTGLFFFKGKLGAPFAIICPGGVFPMSVLFMKVFLTL
jgi:hypothetical protein